MTRVKICGLTNWEDALAAADYGADLLGFIRVSETPRYVGNLDFVRKIADKAGVANNGSPFSGKTLVGVYRDMTDVDSDSEWGVFGKIQYYADSRNYGSLSDTPYQIAAFPMKDADSLRRIEESIQTRKIQPNLTFALLLDAYHKDKLGGSGETFNWDLAIEAKRRFSYPIILAGGLTPENVEEAIRTVRPYAVDVGSGVEAEPGRKDHARLKAFLDAARRANSVPG